MEKQSSLTYPDGLQQSSPSSPRSYFPFLIVDNLREDCDVAPVSDLSVTA